MRAEAGFSEAGRCAKAPSPSSRGRRASLAALIAATALLALPGAASAAPQGVIDSCGSGGGTLGGQFGSASPGAVAVNNSTGDVYVADTGNHRVQRFSSSCAFVSAWGKDVIASGAPGDTGLGFELCTVAANCKAGVASTLGLGGEFNLSVNAGGTGIAVNQTSGDVYVSEGVGSRVQQFTAGGAFVRAFGEDVVSSGAAQADEQQTLTVAATAGQFKLKFGGVETTDVEWNEPASGLEAKLNALTPINTGGGSVVVTGGPGSSTGATPYLVTFAGARADTNQAAIEVKPGTTPLSGAAARAYVATYNEGATGFEVCSAAASCKQGINKTTVPNPGASGLGFGRLAVAPAGTANAGDVLVADPTNNRRVQEFSAAGQFVRAFGADTVATGPDDSGANEQQTVAINATGGNFTLSFGGQTTVPLAFNAAPNDAVAGTPGVLDSVEEALNALSSIGPAGGSVTVSGTAPYAVTFGGALGGDNLAQMTAAAGNLTGGSPSSTATVATAAQGGTAFEICNAAAFDICQKGLFIANGAQTGAGQFESGISDVAEDAAGSIYVAEAGAGNFRVQKLAPSGGGLVPAIFDPQICASPAQSLGGSSASDTPSQLAAGPGGNLLVVRRFPQGGGCPAVSASKEQRVLEFDSAGALVETHVANAGLSAVTGVAADLGSGRIYLSQVGGGGEVPPTAAVTVLGQVPPIGVTDVAVTDVAATTATLRATIAPAAFALHTFYRFEYAPVGSEFWRAAPFLDFDLGNGSGAGDPAACPAGNPPSCQVYQEISALDFEASYKFRVTAHAAFNGGPVTVAGPEFTTFATAPKVTTSPGLWSSPADTAPTLLLSGIVNPGHDRTGYQFQYVSEDAYASSGFAGAASAPVAPGQAGDGSQDIAVTRAVAGLDPALGYRYRLLATNSVGTTAGEAVAIAPPQPGDRYFEWVSNGGDSKGFGVKTSVPAIGESGERAVFNAVAFGESEALPGVSNAFVSERTPHGWVVAPPMLPDPEHVFSTSAFLNSSASEISSDLGATLWPDLTLAQAQSSVSHFGLYRLDGTSTPASPLLTPLRGGGSGGTGSSLGGAAADLSTFVFQFTPPGQPTTYFADEPLYPNTPNAGGLYEVSGASGGQPSASLVNRAEGANGAPLGGDCGAGLGGEMQVATVSGIAPNAVSVDGSVVYFTTTPSDPVDGACSPIPPLRLFKRVDGAHTVAVSQSQCAPARVPACDLTDGNDYFLGASRDGSVVAFASNRQLADSDLDSGAGCDQITPQTGCDVYLYDSSPPPGQPNLVQVSAGDAVPGDHPTVGSGALAMGAIDVAADGSRVYFVAAGRLTADAAQGARNLYVYERDDVNPIGRVAFIAALSPSDRGEATNPNPDWSFKAGIESKYSYAFPNRGPGADGHVLLFTTVAPVAAEDADASRDLYRYDDTAPAGERLRCLSCVGDGPFDVKVLPRLVTESSAAAAAAYATASADAGTVVFSTAEPLLDADGNSAADAYAWHDGALSLLSGATGRFGLATVNRNPSFAHVGISADGGTAFFNTVAPLDAADTNGVADMYAARIGGGFPAATGAEPCGVLAGACAGAAAPPPAGAAPIGSALFSGPGNPARRHCRKGTRLRRGRCLPKRHRHRHHHRKHKRANANGRAPR